MIIIIWRNKSSLSIFTQIPKFMKFCLIQTFFFCWFFSRFLILSFQSCVKTSGNNSKTGFHSSWMKQKKLPKRFSFVSQFLFLLMKEDSREEEFPIKWHNQCVDDEASLAILWGRILMKKLLKDFICLCQRNVRKFSSRAFNFAYLPWLIKMISIIDWIVFVTFW